MLDRRELPWLKRDATSGALYGQILLTDPETGHLGVDIHFGAYSVRHCTHLPIAVPPEPGVHLITGADNVAAVVNNAAGDHFASMKDVNDLIMAARRSPDAVRRGAAVAQRAELGGFLAILVRLLAATSAVGELRSVFAPLLAGAPAEPVPPLPEPSWTRRWTAVALHAFRVGRRTSVADGVRLAASAVRYYRQRLSLAIVADGAPAPLALNEHTCVRLVPLELLEARDDAGDLAGARRRRRRPAAADRRRAGGRADRGRRRRPGRAGGLRADGLLPGAAGPGPLRGGRTAAGAPMGEAGWT